MPFELKNAKTTYQMLVNKVFRELIRNVIEAYVDDMVVKSAKAHKLVYYVRQPLKGTETRYSLAE